MLVLEVLHRTLVLFRCLARSECAQVPALTGSWVDLPRIQAVLTGFEFSDHLGSPFF
jgi:hypothetical protein